MNLLIIIGVIILAIALLGLVLKIAFKLILVALIVGVVLMAFGAFSKRGGRG